MFLGINNIEKMNGEVFQGLKNLKTVWLKANACIDENFMNETEVALMPSVVDEKCWDAKLGATTE